MRRTEVHVPLLDAAPSGALLEAGETAFSAADAMVLADLRGLLGPAADAFWRAERWRREEDPADAPANAALTAWRYARGLTAADETEAWLAARGLGVPHLVRHAERSLVPAAGGAEADPASDGPADEPEPSPELYAELALSGALDGWAWDLAVRAAGWEAWRRAEAPEPSAEVLGAAVRAAEAAPRVPLLPRGPRSRPLLELEVLHRRRTAQVSGDAVRLQRVLAADRLSLLGLDVAYADLPSAAAAREVCLLVEEDGEAFEDAASRAGVRPGTARGIASSFPPVVRERLLSAPVGGVVGPVEVGEAGARVYHVVAKREPALGDPEVRRAISARVVGEWERSEVARCVRWVAWTPAAR